MLVSRLEVLKSLLEEGSLGTQDELREELEKRDFEVTQSTISRDLRRLGAVRALDPQGRTIYRLPSSEEAPIPSSTGGTFRNLVTDIEWNEALVVIHTLPGSASLVARQLDRERPAGILGTIAGDDTIFVAPPRRRKTSAVAEEIEGYLWGE
jgi:transcriptional regulator of arginine metabolism